MAEYEPWRELAYINNPLAASLTTSHIILFTLCKLVQQGAVLEKNTLGSTARAKQSARQSDSSLHSGTDWAETRMTAMETQRGNLA